MRAAVPLVLLLALSGALAALLPAEASAGACSSLRDPACDGTACYYNRLDGQWRCHLAVDWACLVWRPCWYPALP